MTIIQITKDRYLELSNLHQDSDTYIALIENRDIHVVCGIKYKNSDIIQINGLLAFEERKGEELIKNIYSPNHKNFYDYKLFKAIKDKK